MQMNKYDIGYRQPALYYLTFVCFCLFIAYWQTCHSGLKSLWLKSTLLIYLLTTSLVLSFIFIPRSSWNLALGSPIASRSTSIPLRVSLSLSSYPRFALTSRFLLSNLPVSQHNMFRALRSTANFLQKCSYSAQAQTLPEPHVNPNVLYSGVSNRLS